MFNHELKYDLLVALGAFSWIALCIFHAITWTSSAGNSGVAHKQYDHTEALSTSTTQLDPGLAPDPGRSLPEWFVAGVLGNVGVVFIYHYLKHHLLRQWSSDVKQLESALDSKITLLETSKSRLETEILKISFENKVLTNTIRTNQSEFTRLTQILLNTLDVMSHNGSSKPVFGSELDSPANALNGLTKNTFSRKKPLVNRKSVHSIRSEMILRRITRELLQPIRKQCNDMRNGICRDHQAQRLSFLQQQNKLQRKSRSQSSITTKAKMDNVIRRKEKYISAMNAPQATFNVGENGLGKTFASYSDQSTSTKPTISFSV